MDQERKGSAGGSRPKKTMATSNPTLILSEENSEQQGRFLSDQSTKNRAPSAHPTGQPNSNGNRKFLDNRPRGSPLGQCNRKFEMMIRSVTRLRGSLGKWRPKFEMMVRSVARKIVPTHYCCELEHNMSNLKLMNSET